MLLIRYCVLVNKLLIVWHFLLYEACDRNPAKVFFLVRHMSSSNCCKLSIKDTVCSLVVLVTYQMH